jgi:hypothetical protein
MSPLHRLTDRAVERVLRRERTAVEQPELMLRMLVIELGAFVVVIVCWFAALWGDSAIANSVATVVTGVALGMSAMPMTRRAHAYRAGWLRGRAQFVASLEEAHRRGFSLQQWLEAELARDLSVLGLPSYPQHDDERDESD